jgi:hypothetical protein
VSLPTVGGYAVEGLLYREAQSCLGTRFAGSYYLFFLSGTSTAANVYQNGTLTTAFPTVGNVASDNYGRFPPIYLDPSVTYRVQFFNASSVMQWQQDPYVSQLSTVGTSSLSAYGLNIAVTGEASMPGPNSGGTGVTLTLNAGSLGSTPLSLNGTVPGNSAIIINNSATTGSRTATFAATNKPGTSTSAPAGWLPITCDGVQYYTPIWHGNPFTPYVANPSAQGENISGSSVTFTGTGLTTVTNGTATPGNWYTPAFSGVGSGYYINVTKTVGLSGLSFMNAVTLTAAPSGATYTGGTLTAAWVGATNNNYAITLSTGQIIAGCTLTFGGTTLTCPSTSIAGTASASIFINVQGNWINIGAGGLTITSNGQASVVGPYQLSTSITGTTIVASGAISLSSNYGGQSPTYNGSTPITFGANGTANLAGVAASNWYSPTTAGIGNTYYLKITQTGGTAGYTFNGYTSGYTVIGGGASVGVSGPTGSTYSVTGTYSISSNSAGTAIVGTGSLTLTGGTDVQSPNYSGTTPLVLAGNGAATQNGVATSSWYSPNTANVGSGYWIDITRTGGNTGVNFSAAQGSWTNITNSGLTIDMTGYTGLTGTITVSGTYQISNSSGGTPVLGSGTVALSIVIPNNVQSNNYSGTTPLVLAGNGSTTLNGAAAASWLSPNAANVGSGYWVNITRTGGTSGVNFTAAQGSWTNITNTGITIDINGYTGDIGTVSASGTYQISNSAGGSPVLGSGTISLSKALGSVTHTYTSGSGATETVPANASTVVIEVFGAGGGGGGGASGCGGSGGGGGGSGGYSRSSYACSGGKTLIYTAPSTGASGGTVNSGGNTGASSSVSSGTLSITTMTAAGGTGGGSGSATGAGGGGGAASGGNVVNTTGNAGTAHSGGSGGAGGVAVVGVNGSGTSGGRGGAGGAGGATGGSGTVVFTYT